MLKEDAVMLLVLQIIFIVSLRGGYKWGGEGSVQKSGETPNILIQAADVVINIPNDRTIYNQWINFGCYMQHHGVTDNYKMTKVSWRLPIWSSGQMAQKSAKLVFFLFFLLGRFSLSSKNNCQTDTIPQGHNSNHRQKKPQTVLTELCISEHCFIKCFHVFF